MRAFIAIEPTPAVLAALGKEIDRLQATLKTSGIRWVAPQSIHLTLRFLGEVPVSHTNPLAELLRRVAGGVEPFDIHVQSLGGFPNLRAPRNVWAGVADPGGALSDLQVALESELGSLSYPAENRPFHAHFTLGRVRREVSSQDRRDLGRALVSSGRVHFGSMRVESIKLIRSELRPAGPIYTTLVTAPLGT